MGILDNLIQGHDPLETSYQNDDSLLAEIYKRNEKYTHLIKTYDKYVEDTVTFKSRMRWVAFWFFMGVFFIIVCFAIGSIQILAHKGSVSAKEVATIITAAVSLVSAIVVLPEKIVTFIFNGDEDKYIVDLIKSTQKFDKK